MLLLGSSLWALFCVLFFAVFAISCKFIVDFYFLKCLFYQIIVFFFFFVRSFSLYYCVKALEMRTICTYVHQLPFLTFLFVCLLVPFAVFCKSLYGCMCYFSRVLVKVLLWVSMGGPIILNLFTVLYPSCLRLLNLLFIVHLYLNCIGSIVVSIICVHERPMSNIQLCIVDYFSLCHLCVQTILQTFSL